MTNSHFGQNVVATREELGMNRSELLRTIESSGTQMHMTTLRRIESGEQEPKLSEAKAISDALGLSIEQLSVPEGEAAHLRSVWSATAKHKQATDKMLMALLDWAKATDNALLALRDAARQGVPLSELRAPLDEVDRYSTADDIERFLIQAGETAVTQFSDSLTAEDVYEEFRRLNSGGSDAEG